MTNRRDFLGGLICIGALGAAEALRPSHHVVRMPAGKTLADIVPPSFGPWQLGGDGEIVQPRTEGTLATRLYSDQLARIYHHRDDPARQVMLSIAYGSEQSDALQMHRPEACYPAVGFTTAQRQETRLGLHNGASIPTVTLAAYMQQRSEDIVYWTRLGTAFPRDNGEQRNARLKAALQGQVPDGVLVRASAIRVNHNEPQFADLNQFLTVLAENLPPTAHRVLLG